MEIGPILRALNNNKTRFWLISVEVALTLAVVVNCLTIILDHRRQILCHSGMAEEDLVVVTTDPFGPSFKHASFVDQVRDNDLLRLRAHPGVQDACAIDYLPLAGAGSIDSRQAVGSTTEIGVPNFVVGAHCLQTLGVELVQGRDFTAEDFEGLLGSGDTTEPRNVILTAELAELFFPNGNAVGKQIESADDPVRDTVVGVISHMHNAWPNSHFAGRVMLRPGKPGTGRRLRYLVRSSPGAVDLLVQELERVVLGVNSERLVRVRTLLEYKNHYYNDSFVVIRVLTWVIGLLVLVTSLGIVGLTSSSVTQRTRQIGTRRALGATKPDIVRYFLVEVGLVSGIGLVVGSLCAVLLNSALVQLAGASKLDVSILAVSALGIWAASFVAAAIPSYRATLVAPEMATRSV